jgi:hypothetical protein
LFLFIKWLCISSYPHISFKYFEGQALHIEWALPREENHKKKKN